MARVLPSPTAHHGRVAALGDRGCVPMSRPIYVLGTGLSHDGSACLLKDGKIHVAIEKERITRIKHDGMNDLAAVTYCLDAAGIRYSDLTLVVQNANFSNLEQNARGFHGPRLFDPQVPAVTISHHLAHAYSAFGASPFDEAATLVIDGCGNAYADCIDLESAELLGAPPPDRESLFFEKDSLYRTTAAGTLETVCKDFSPWGRGAHDQPLYPRTTLDSIGGAYHGVSTYVFSGIEDAGKLMGLAPYGRPGAFDGEIFDLCDGRVFLRYDWMAHFDRPCRDYAQFKANFQYYADIAYWAQREIERALLYVLNDRYRRSPSDNLCYAGGVALNAVANRRLLTEGPYKNIYIQPAAGDNGLAVGCAYYGWLVTLGKPRQYHDGRQAFGRAFPTAAANLGAIDAGWTVTSYEPGDLVAKVAQMIADGAIVGWFQGGAEFGPRALGNRSILADPRRADMRDRINRDVKDREDFRPFAPSVLAEDMSVYFDCDVESPYMLYVAPVRERWRSVLPSVVHQDGSARIQSVRREFNARYYELLAAFKAITGLGVLLNTSLNKRGMPIVETPEQAVDLFRQSALDVLVLGTTVLTKA
jgi:carbamoyltransferase